MTSASTVKALVTRLRGPAVYLIAGLLTRVGFFALIPFYARRLSPEAYGDYVLAQTLLAAAPIFALGFPASLSRFYFDVPDRQKGRRRVGTVAKWMLAITIFAGALALALIALFANPAAEGLSRPRALVCMVIACAGSVMGVIPAQFFRDSRRPVAASIFQVAEFVLVVGTGILFVNVLGRGLDGALEALAVTYAAMGLAATLFTFAYLGGAFDPSIFRQALKFSLPFVFHFAALWVQSVADRWTLKFAGRDADLGPYGLASQLASPPGMVVNAWNLERSARTGEVYRQSGTLGVRREMAAMLRSYVVASALPALVILAASPVIRPLLGDRFHNALAFLPAFLVASVVEALYLPNFQVVYYDSKASWISTVTVLSAVASVVAAALLVPLAGVWGALVARIAASAIRSGAMAVAAWRCFALARGGPQTHKADPRVTADRP